MLLLILLVDDEDVVLVREPFVGEDGDIREIMCFI